MPLEAVHLQAQHGHAQACPQARKPRVVRENSVCITVLTEPSVYPQPFSAQQ
jgi:hypothetical protein